MEDNDSIKKNKSKKKDVTTKKPAKQNKSVKTVATTKPARVAKSTKATKSTKVAKTIKSVKDGQPVKSPKKRGRKPKNAVIKTTPDDGKANGKTYSVSGITDKQSPSENIILHLPVHSDDIVSETNQGNVPHATNTTGLNDNESFLIDRVNDLSANNFSEYPFSKKSDTTYSTPQQDSIVKNNYKIDTQDLINHDNQWHSNEFKDMVDSPKTFQKLFETLLDDRWRSLSVEDNHEYKKKVFTLMKEFVNEGKHQRIPNSTPIYCFWCCHPFTTQPFSLPLYKKNGVYHTYGNFCCPECCVAYNFNDFQDHDNQWNRYTLIHELYRKVFKDPQLKIKPALPRQCLTIFGGPLSINQFRAKNACLDKTYTLRFPPISSIVVQQDEIDLEINTNKSNQNIFIPVDPDRIIEANNNLKLKRSKPHNKNKNTLESCMNLEFFPNKSD